MADQRPDPDALLARLVAAETQSHRGRLKVFFGASAGVGKTYAMLQVARERKAAGGDVVAGYVETHGRRETDALLEGLELLPSRSVDYRGVRLREFDLDAALCRRPGLVLLDELAHTNAEGSRHAKRWQDVSELLDAGIDVYATVNVQHIESLNDVVARITGVVVRETIPDAIIERADEIELIDLPPDDLLQRLREGKVYIADQAELAAQRFFRREILAALRELALRKTADRVNAQVQIEKAGLAIRQTWQTADRLLVCVGPSPLSARVVRVGRRMASSLRCQWLAACVETPSFTPEMLENARRNLRLAERLGAETATVTGERAADELIALARKRNVTRIIIGKPAQPRWREWLRGSIVEELIRLSGDIDVHVVKGEPEDADRPSHPSSSAVRPTDWRPYAMTAGVMVLCTAVAWAMFSHFSAVNLTMVYLAGVVFVATRCGPRPSAAAAVLAPLLFNFFFTAPYYTFAIADTQYVVTFLVLLVTAMVVSGLTQRVRRQSEAVRTRYLRTVALYFMSRMLAGAPDRQAVISVAGRHMKDVFGGEVVILAPRGDGSLACHGEPGDWFTGNVNEAAAAQWVFEHQKWAGRGTDTLPMCKAFYVPLVASGKPLGVLGVRLPEDVHGLEPDQRHLLETFATQLAIALERAAFAEEAQFARVQAETEQLRNSLLSCVSHDLRTPLATIAGSASALLNDAAALSPQQHRELLRSIADESEHLNELVAKLLEMTRLEAPGFQLARDWFPPEELIGSALTRLERGLRSHVVETDVPAGLPLLFVDGALVEQVLVNLIENAMKYTPAGSTIRVTARVEARAMRVEVSDDGPGLAPGTEDTVFEKFIRQRPSTDRGGVGLGLTICRAIVQLHGGQVGAQNRPRGGACFWFTIPQRDQPEFAVSTAKPPASPPSSHDPRPPALHPDASA
jgi:two-component system sensor histidine kinase KdpD